MASAKTNRSGCCLTLFTDRYPFGKSETFLESEIRYLAGAFDAVRVIPRRADPSVPPRPLPAGVELRPALFQNGSRGHALLRGAAGRAPWRPFLREFRDKQVYRSPKRWVKWLEAWCVVRRMAEHPDYPFADPAGRRTVLYFYWGVGCSWVLPFLPSGTDAVVRYHGHDLYEERGEYRGYMPFRAEQLRASRLSACVSEHGLRYLRRRYASIPFAAAVHRLGVEDQGLAPAEPSAVFRIVTCSRLVALKRLDLLADALVRLEFPVCWTHIGDGPLAGKLKERAASLPPSVSVTWTGSLPNAAVRRYYLQHPQDLFVNVSAAEGAPVAVMEALNAGLPVLATDVGGSRELFDEEAGWLLPADLTTDDLVRALRVARAAPGWEARRLAARRCWTERSNAALLYPAFSACLRGE